MNLIFKNLNQVIETLKFFKSLLIFHQKTLVTKSNSNSSNQINVDDEFRRKVRIIITYDKT